MNIGIHDSDGTTYPNVALMKLSAWHKARGDAVSFYKPMFDYDRVYSSKVFTFTPQDDGLVHPNVIRGGTGYDKTIALTDEQEHTCPDYSLYGATQSYGFLTRGCPNKCGWCIVPAKEGQIRAHADVEEFARHKEVVLMDNNVLAHTHGLDQIQKMVRLGLKVDFNQGLDARLIDDEVARMLANLKWLHPLRLACDQASQIPHIEKAVRLLRWHNCTPQRYFVYTLVKDVEDAMERVKFLKGMYLDPFAQPYHDFSTNAEPTPEQKQFCRWVNHKAIFKSVPWNEYK